MENKEVSIKPIGFVRTKATEEDIRSDRKNIVSEIEIDAAFKEALEGLEGYSHIFVIFFMHQVAEQERRRLKVHPRHRTDLPPVGIFAVRKPARPNPIGLTVVDLLERKEDVLKVKGLDALDGSPVLDIKAYDHIDVKENIRVPKWWYASRVMA